MIKLNSYVGSSVERIEDLRLLRGRGTFIDDLAHEGMLYAAIVRSPVAHGHLRSVDMTQTRLSPGVRAVITAADIGLPMPMLPLRIFTLPEVVPYEQPVIAHEKVRYVGEPIAVILADSLAQAEDALDKVELDIEPLPVIADRQSALNGDVFLFEGSGSNSALVYTARRGDPDSVRAETHRLREVFKVHRHTAVTMEPRGILAIWDDTNGRLIVSGAVKNPFAIRDTLAKLMKLPNTAIDMMEMDVGGGFGVRGDFYPEDFLISFAARFVKRPVKWTEDRREHFLAANHARDMDCELELEYRDDGTIVALRGRVRADIGAYLRSSGAIASRNVAQFLAGPYRIPNVLIESVLVVTNKTPSGVYRGPGRFEGDFFRERLFDIVAADLGLDPVEFRRRNLLTARELPYAVATLTPTLKNDALDNGDYHSTFDKCLVEFGWQSKQHLQGKVIEGRYHGLGVGCFIEGSATGPKEVARIVVEPAGGVTLSVGSAALGQGLETVCAQIAADALGLPPDRIRVLHGSTTNLSEGYGSFHSRAVVMGGSAILDASAKLLALIRERGATLFGCPASQIRLMDEAVMAPDGRTVPWTELAISELAADGAFVNSLHTYSYGTHAAHVAVDPGTGQVEIMDYVAVEDVGRIMNPMLLRGQIMGAVVQGLGGVFLEHLVYDAEGQLLTASLADYLLPTATDFPKIRIFTLEEHPSLMNPLGAKGAGEGGIIPVAGVIGNAIAAALAPLAVKPCELPLSPMRVWQSIVAVAGVIPRR